MQGTRHQRGARRTRGGCPPILEIDLTHSDPVGPAVEWPEGPPTRRTRSSRCSDVQVEELTTGRAVRLLDAAVAHLRTSLETTSDPAEATRIEDAIADASRALARLQVRPAVP